MQKGIDQWTSRVVVAKIRVDIYKILKIVQSIISFFLTYVRYDALTILMSC